MLDLIIVGAGPAGITASVYAARKRMDLLVITRDIGGQTALSGDIENYTGYQFITGPELAAKFEEHMREYGIKLKEDEQVTGIKREENTVRVKTGKGAYEAETVVVASGKRPKELAVAEEAQFKNKGLSYCATCDAPLFSGKDVAVVGGGNSGLDATLQLIKIARKIYLLDSASALTGDAVMQEKVKESSKVSIFVNTQVTAILGERMVSGIKVKRQEKEETLPLQGVFVEIGLTPSCEFAEELEKNEKGEIKVDCRNRTNIPGIFAAGDVTDVPEKQVIVAAGEGAKAALGAFRYLSRHK